ncbi:MAG: energy transducer TonB [Bacteroidia bacterium]|nr:energy transducer TonB [Bacteroidia bacterium]
MKKQLKNKKKKNFIRTPEYPGGNIAFKKFIRNNLKYPPEAIEKGIEGIVHLNLWLDDNGDVIDVKIAKGIGYGCDEEAIRLAKLIKYGGVKNRGIRVKFLKKLRIVFRLSENHKIIYEYKESAKKQQDKKSTGIISYTIKW